MPYYSYDRRIAGSYLYHVAPKYALSTILSSGNLKSPRPKGQQFLSFSDKPLTKFKTRVGGAVFVFDQSALKPLVVEVDYYDAAEFLAKYPLAGAYVAHYATPGSFLIPEKHMWHYGGDSEIWDEMYPPDKAQRYRRFFDVVEQLSSFASEKEWVTKEDGTSVPLRPPYLAKILVIGSPQLLASVRKLAAANGINVPIDPA